MEPTPHFDPDRVIEVSSQDVSKTSTHPETTPLRDSDSNEKGTAPTDPTATIPQPEADRVFLSRTDLIASVKSLGRTAYKFSSERTRGAVELSSIAATGIHKAILNSRRNTVHQAEHESRLSSEVRKETAKAVVEGRYPADHLAPVTKSEQRVGIKTAKRGHKIAKKAYEKQRLEMALGEPVKTTVSNPRAIQRNQPESITVTATDSRGEPIFDLSTGRGRARRNTSRYPAARRKAERMSSWLYDLHDRAVQDLLEEQQATINGSSPSERRKSRAGGSQAKSVKLDRKIDRVSNKLDLKKRKRSDRLAVRRQS